MIHKNTYEGYNKLCFELDKLCKLLHLDMKSIAILLEEEEGIIQENFREAVWITSPRRLGRKVYIMSRLVQYLDTVCHSPLIIHTVMGNPAFTHKKNGRIDSLLSAVRNEYYPLNTLLYLGQLASKIYYGKLKIQEIWILIRDEGIDIEYLNN